MRYRRRRYSRRPSRRTFRGRRRGIRAPRIGYRW